MSVLDLQHLEPELNAFNAASWSVTSSSSDCCKNEPELEQQ
ncbi:class III lanthipeptide [Streptomyces sp. XM4193]|nr:class III lanthipeptide [Streptomyces sp. XM4193]MCK1798039.1 class III lanthipeptide [Streptomyces sp. XM4193]